MEVIFFEEYYVEELVGKVVKFKVKLYEIKFKEFLVLDDEFVKDVDEEVEILEVLKVKIKEKL